MDKHILPYFKEINLKDVTPLRYKKFLNHLSDKGYSRRTIEIVHTTFFNAMKVAVKPLRKIEFNPCEDVTLPNGNDSKKSKSIPYIESDKVESFLKVARQDNYIYYIYFKALLETGMRKDEAAALQRKDIDLENCLISITKTLDFQAKPDEELFDLTKTYDSERVIKISRSFRDELIKHMEFLDTNKEIHNEIYNHELDLVFCREDGNFLPKSTLFNSFSRILEKASIKIPIHGLRHTHAVMLLESGASMKFIQERLGHKNITITSDVYSHISKKLEANTVDKYEEYINNLIG